MHRVWIQVNVSAPAFLDRTLTRFYTYARECRNRWKWAPIMRKPRSSPGGGFEPMQDANLFPELNTLTLHLGRYQLLPAAGATEATLQELYPICSWRCFDFRRYWDHKQIAADADIRHRCAVRLTAVTTQSASGQTLVDPLFDINGVASPRPRSNRCGD